MSLNLNNSQILVEESKDNKRPDNVDKMIKTEKISEIRDIVTLIKIDPKSPFYYLFEAIRSSVTQTITNPPKFNNYTVPMAVAEGWRQYVPIEVWRLANGQNVYKTPNFLCGRALNSFLRYNANNNAQLVTPDRCVKRVTLSIGTSRIFAPSPSVMEMVGAFNGSAMSGTITSNIRTDTTHYAANVPINLAKAFGSVPKNIKITNDMSLVYTKIMLYINSRVQSLSPSLTNFACEGFSSTMSRQANAFSIIMPYRGVAAPAAINARIITMEDYTSVLVGNRNVPVGWESSRWGQSIAIVPIRTSDCSNTFLNPYWTAMFMYYPINTIFYNSSQMDDGQTIIAGGAPIVVPQSTMSGMVSIPGPTDQVLFVVVDTMNRGDNFSVILTNIQVTMAANYLDVAGMADQNILLPIVQVGVDTETAPYIGCLTRAQEYFPDYESYRNGVINSSELGWTVPFSHSKWGTAGIACENISYNLTAAGNAKFPIPHAGYQNTNNFIDSYFNLCTSPLGVTLLTRQMPIGNEVNIPLVTHTLGGEDHRVSTAYASRYYLLGMDTWRVPTSAVEFMFLSYEVAMKLAAGFEITAWRMGLDANVYNGAQLWGQLAQSKLTNLQNKVRELFIASNMTIVPTYSNNFTNVHINAVRPPNFLGTPILFSACRLSLRNIARVFPEFSTGIATQLTTTVVTTVSSTRIANALGTKLDACTYGMDTETQAAVMRLSFQVDYGSNVPLYLTDKGNSLQTHWGMTTSHVYDSVAFVDELLLFANMFGEQRMDPVYTGMGTLHPKIDATRGNKLTLTLVGLNKTFISDPQSKLKNTGTMVQAPYVVSGDQYDITQVDSGDSDRVDDNDIFGSTTVVGSNFRY